MISRRSKTRDICNGVHAAASSIAVPVIGETVIEPAVAAESHDCGGGLQRLQKNQQRPVAQRWRHAGLPLLAVMLLRHAQVHPRRQRLLQPVKVGGELVQRILH